MLRFCVDNCNNTLEVVTGADTFVFVCRGCGKKYQPTPEDTRIIHQTNYSSQSDKYKDLLACVKHDVSVPEVFVDGGCKKCKAKVVKKIRIQDNLAPTYVCSCGYIWS